MPTIIWWVEVWKAIRMTYCEISSGFQSKTIERDSKGTLGLQPLILEFHAHAVNRMEMQNRAKKQRFFVPFHNQFSLWFRSEHWIRIYFQEFQICNKPAFVVIYFIHWRWNNNKKKIERKQHLMLVRNIKIKFWTFAIWKIKWFSKVTIWNAIIKGFSESNDLIQIHTNTPGSHSRANSLIFANYSFTKKEYDCVPTAKWGRGPFVIVSFNFID